MNDIRKTCTYEDIETLKKRSETLMRDIESLVARLESKSPLPFDGAKARECIVRVNRDCGFVAGGRYVITAAHCFSESPHRVVDNQFATVKSWDGSEETRLAVRHYELMADIAVLANETASGSYGDKDAFARFVERTGSARLDLSADLPSRLYVRTHMHRWLTVSTETLLSDRAVFYAFVDEGKEIIQGSSGAPFFNDNGEVVGFVSAGGSGKTAGAGVLLWSALPGWLINELQAKGDMPF